MFLLSLVPTCPKNRKHRGFSDVWDSYDQCELSIPDGWRFLRRDRKNREHFYFEGTSQTAPTSEIFTMSVNMKFFVWNGRRRSRIFTVSESENMTCLSRTSGMLDFVFICYQNFIFNELSIINV